MRLSQAPFLRGIAGEVIIRDGVEAILSRSIESVTISNILSWTSPLSGSLPSSVISDLNMSSQDILSFLSKPGPFDQLFWALP